MVTRRYKGTHSSLSARKRNQWSSSVVGTHASNAAPKAGKRTSSRSSARKSSARMASSQQAQVNQIYFKSHSVDERTAARHRSGSARTARKVRQRNIMNRAGLVLIIVVVLAIAVGLGVFAYRASINSSLSLTNSSAEDALVAVDSDESVYYVLLAGITDEGTTHETASYLAVLRVDTENQVLSLLNIPSNISATYDDAEEGQDMLRDAPSAADEGQLVTQVASLIEQDINHYVRVTSSDFTSLIDSLGGLDITVDVMVDDPTVGIEVIDPGEQTLSGSQVLTYVSAKNYVSGYEQRSLIQNEVLNALIETLQSKGGIDAVLSTDELSNKVETDMTYDALNEIASIYAQGTFYSATVPGSEYSSDGSTYWSVSSSSFEALLEEFIAGDDMDISVDTSGVEKSSLSITVLNGAGVDGYGSAVAEALESAGYTVEETGNAESFVYDETLVIYADEDDEVAAEAIVEDLGIGRTVAAGVYYSLSTDIQVMVGKDWVS